MSRRTFWLRLLVLTAAALLLRLAAAAHTLVIARDGITYLELAAALRRGDLALALSSHYPPGFPALLALGGASESAARLSVACASVLLIPALALLGALAHGARAGLLAGALAAILPLFVELGAEVLSDGPFLALLAATLLALHRLQEGDRGWPAWGLAAAVLGGAAYLVRPEGLLVLGAGAAALVLLPRPAGQRSPRARAAALLVLALPGLLALLPYLASIVNQPVLGGQAGTGALKLTKKQNLPQLLAALGPRLAWERSLELTRRTLITALPLLPGLAALAWRRALPPRSRRLGWCLLLVGAALFAAFVVVRADRRFTAQLALLAVPHAGLGLAWLARRARARRPGLRAEGLLVLALALGCLPVLLRDRRAAKAIYRDAGAMLAQAGARRVLAHDSRAAYYAGAVSLPLVTLLPPDLPPAERPAAIVSLVATQHADALVLVVISPAQVEEAREVAERLGVTPRELRQPGQVPLQVFLLGPAGDPR